MAASLGQKIRQLRRERKITQQELAQGLVTASMISQIESDRATPSIKLLEDIANRLGIESSYFVDEVSLKIDQAHTYRRAKAHIESEQFESALPLLLKLIDPVSPHFKEELLYNDLAHCYQKLGELDEAVQMYERVVQVALEREDVHTAVHAYFHLGHLERKRNQISPARMFWQRASELLKRHPEVRMPLAMKIEANLGRVHLMLHQFLEAKESYLKAASLAEHYSASLDLAAIEHGLATVYMELKDFDEAFLHCERARELYATSQHQRGINQCQINMSVIKRRQGKIDEALDDLNQCIAQREVQQDPIRLANALQERALCHLQLESFQAAIDDALPALNIDKENVELQLTLREILAESYIGLNQGDKALDIIQASTRYTGTVTDRTSKTTFKRLKYLAQKIVGQSEEALEAAQEYADSLLSTM